MGNTMADFLQRIQDTILLCDGAMGTVLYGKGVFINRCFEELNISDPDLVRDVHRDYVRAGVDIIETNTFGANRIRLRQQELDDRFEKINRRAVELARSEAEDEILVAGSIGPTGRAPVPEGTLPPEEVEAAFREQASVLASAGVDLFILETFHLLDEILIAIRAAKEETGLPVVAQVAFNREGILADGGTPEEAARQLHGSAADVIGTNCGLGPRQTFEIVRRFHELTDKPVSAQPNAGFPEEIGGRTLYLNTPEYMATYAQHMIRSGVRLVGGCCGSTPAHIRAVRGSVRMLAHGRLVIHTSEPREHEEARDEVPLPERSPLAARFAHGKKVYSVEIPPPRGATPAKFLDSCRALRDAGVHLVNIPDGPRAIARMSNMLAALLVKEQVGIESIQHFCSRDRNLLGIQSFLLGAHAVGLHNVLFITGDPPKVGDYPEATAVFDVDSIGMIRIARNLNRGLDMGGKPMGDQTHLFIATGAEPAAFDIEEEIRRLRLKVESGAEVVFTQPVYDLDTLDKFLGMIEDLPVPLMIGLLPLASHRNAEFLHNEVPGMSIPDPIRERMRKAGSGTEAQDEGIAIAREAVDACKDRARGFYVMPPFGRHDAAIRVLEGLI
jgi:homocysteine S-methyltransferase